jgi:hypothetical protein
MTQSRYNDESELPPSPQRDPKHEELAKCIHYSERYRDKEYEYRYVPLPVFPPLTDNFDKTAKGATSS